MDALEAAKAALDSADAVLVGAGAGMGVDSVRPIRDEIEGRVRGLIEELLA